MNCKYGRIRQSRSRKCHIWNTGFQVKTRDQLFIQINLFHFRTLLVWSMTRGTLQFLFQVLVLPTSMLMKQIHSKHLLKEKRNLCMVSLKNWIQQQLVFKLIQLVILTTQHQKFSPRKQKKITNVKLKKWDKVTKRKQRKCVEEIRLVIKWQLQPGNNMNQYVTQINFHILKKSNAQMLKVNKLTLIWSS